MAKIQRALLSVTDKTGLVDFARHLAGMGVELISTGGTSKLLRESGIAVKDISDLTGFPEMLDGRVKTLHPKVHGGILHIRENPQHLAAVAEHGIQPIDMVVVNLYAFEKTASRPGVGFHDIIENIDIGGSVDGALGGQEFSGCRHRDLAVRLRRYRPRDVRPWRIAAAGDQVASGAESICHYGGLRLRDCIDAGAHRATRGRQVHRNCAARISRDAASVVPQGIRSALWREPAPEGRALRRRFGQRE